MARFNYVNGYYDGDVDAQRGEPHGRGRMIAADGTVTEGVFENGAKK